MFDIDSDEIINHYPSKEGLLLALNGENALEPWVQNNQGQKISQFNEKPKNKELANNTYISDFLKSVRKKAFIASKMPRNHRIVIADIAPTLPREAKTMSGFFAGKLKETKNQTLRFQNFSKYNIPGSVGENENESFYTHSGKSGKVGSSGFIVRANKLKSKAVSQKKA